ncbi:MAG: hypothetical protein Q4F00_11940, partial [bacterium]|nr:hypothetical protein [bacterium]
ANAADAAGDAGKVANAADAAGDASKATKLGKAAKAAGAASAGLNVVSGGYEMIDGIKDGDAHKVLEGAGNFADGAGDIASLAAKGGSKLAKGLGVAGGVASTVAGGAELVEGIKEGDAKKIATGALDTVAGISATIGCCCPVAAPAAFAVSAVCSIISFGIDLFG